jgi:hypothetical protein
METEQHNKFTATDVYPTAMLLSNTNAFLLGIAMCPVKCHRLP